MGMTLSEASQVNKYVIIPPERPVKSPLNFSEKMICFLTTAVKLKT